MCFFTWNSGEKVASLFNSIRLARLIQQKARFVIDAFTIFEQTFDLHNFCYLCLWKSKFKNFIFNKCTNKNKNYTNKSKNLILKVKPVIVKININFFITKIIFLLLKIDWLKKAFILFRYIIICIRYYIIILKVCQLMKIKIFTFIYSVTYLFNCNIDYCYKFTS